MFHTFACTSSTLFFFSFPFPLALPPFPPLAPPLPLLLALPLLSHPPYSGRSHKLLINFSRIHINTKRSTSIEFRKNCPVWIYIYIYIYILFILFYSGPLFSLFALLMLFWIGFALFSKGLSTDGKLGGDFFAIFFARNN